MATQQPFQATAPHLSRWLDSPSMALSCTNVNRSLTPQPRAPENMRLPPGVILDGEAVVYLSDADGNARISFEAAQSRALSRPRRARELADRHPATYMAFDVLAHPAAGFPDLRPHPYVERRQVLLDVLPDAGPSIVPVWSTTDLDEAPL